MAAKRKPAAPDYAALSEAQTAHEAAGRPSYNGPLYQAVARGEFPELRRRLTAGDEWALVTALMSCATHELPMPDWLAAEWLKRLRAAMHYRAKSWDDVLPPIKPKGRKLATLRTEREWTLIVVQSVFAEAQTGKPVDDGLFDALAKQKRWPLSGALAKKLYYAARKKPNSLTRIYFDQLTARRHGPAPSTIRRRS